MSYHLENIKLKALMRGTNHKPIVFQSAEDAAWYVKSYEQSMSDYRLIKLKEKSIAELRTV